MLLLENKQITHFLRHHQPLLHHPCHHRHHLKISTSSHPTSTSGEPSGVLQSGLCEDQVSWETQVNLGQGRACPSGDHSFPLRASSIEPSRHHHRHRATTASSSSSSFRKSYILQNIMIPSEDPLDIYMMGKLVKRIVWTSGKSGLFDNWGLRGQRPLDQSALGA